MKITKPLQHISTELHVTPIPCWFFEDVPLPDYAYDEDVIWQPIRGTMSLLDDDNYNSRKVASNLDNKSSKIFQELSLSVKKLLIEIKNNHPIDRLEEDWPINTWSKELLDPLYDIAIDLKRDSKGFSMGKHLDNRNTKWTLIMNLKDHNSSTVVHTKDGDISAPSKKGSGIFYFNHQDMLHSVGPIVDEDRITLFWMNIII